MPVHPRSRWYLAVALVALVELAIPTTAQACSCSGDGWGDVVAVAHSVDVVFLGTVVSVDVPWTLTQLHNSDETLARSIYHAVGSMADHSVQTLFAVEQAWKGVDSSEVVVDSGTGLCCDCSLGARWLPGERVLIFGVRGEHGLVHVGSCTPSRDPQEAEHLIAALGPGQRSFPAPPRSADSSKLLFGLLGLLTALGVLTMLVHRS